MAPDLALLEALNLPEDVEQEEISTALTCLVTSAIHDDQPKQTLSQIYSQIVSTTGKDYLDPLNLVPLLLPSTDHAAQNILALIGECCSSREVTLTIQESLESLRHAFENADEADSEDPPTSAKQAPLSTQLATLLNMYAAAITRMKLRRKPASEIIQPFIQETEATIKVAVPMCNQDESLIIIASICHLSKRLKSWCHEVILKQDSELAACKTMTKTLLDRTLIVFSGSFRSMIAQRTLENCFPRQTIFSSNRYNWEMGERAVKDVLDTYELMGRTPSKTAPFSTSDLFFFAYETVEDFQPMDILPPLMPVIISAFQTDTFVDEALAALLKIFHAYQAKHETQVLAPDISAGLCNILPSIASAHPDPLVRNQVFRCLSLVLSASDSHSRFLHLKEMCDDHHYPQLRVASVGLVKEALLRSISDPMKSDKYFTKPLFLSAFGPILFRPNPPDLFLSNISLKDFQENPESARLVECLSLYYILIHRDTQNMTGIRDSDMRQTIDKNFLSPLKNAIGRWSEGDSTTPQGHIHDISPIVSLQISIDRIEKAHKDLY